MNLLMLFRGFADSAASRPALQAGLVAAAAVAGYVTIMPSQPKPATSAVVASMEQPQWAGHIEPPDTESAPRTSAMTSASYAAQDPSLIGDGSKKTGTQNITATPKPLNKPLLPPRRPSTNEEASSTSAPTRTIALAPEAELKQPAPARGLLSPVTDRLPSSGTLLRPFNVVNDAVHNLIKSF